MRKLISMLIAAALITGLTACGSSGKKEGDGKKEKKKFSLVYVMPSTESQYWGEYTLIGVENAVEDLEKKYDVKIDFTTAGPAQESETDAYVKALENVIAKKPDAIVTATTIPDATAPLVQDCHSQGIVVNFFGMAVDDEYADYYGSNMRSDQGQLGESAAKALLDSLKAKGIEPEGKVGIHMSQVIPSLAPRIDNFVKYLKENAPKLECLETLYNENDVTNAQANVENQISTYGDKLIGLYGANNISGDGIALAVENAGKGDKIASTAIDSDDLEVKALEAGNLSSIIVQDPYKIAYDATTAAYEIKAEEKEYEKDIVVDCAIVTKENMKEEKFAALLDPTLNKRK